jgi:hypothetical protein
MKTLKTNLSERVEFCDPVDSWAANHEFELREARYWLHCSNEAVDLRTQAAYERLGVAAQVGQAIAHVVDLNAPRVITRRGDC